MPLVLLPKKVRKYFLFLLAFSFLFPFATHAEEDTYLSGALRSCEVINNNGNAYLTDFQNAGEVESFFTQYDQVKNRYHTKVNTIFNEHFDLLNGEEKQQENICSPFAYDQKTSVLQLNSTINAEHDLYRCALLYLAEKPTLHEPQKSLVAGMSNLRTQEYLYLKEIEDSYAAKEMTLQIYSQMRLWYPVHRDLQCLIEELKLYNEQVRIFVDRVVLMPKKFLNYGSQTPH